MVAGRYDVGGASAVIENLAAQLCRKGIEATIGAFTFVRIPPKNGYEVRNLLTYNFTQLKRFLDNFDIIHSHHALTNYLSLVCHKSFIYHYHGAPNFGTGYFYRLNMILSLKLTSQNLNAVISVSQSGSDMLKQYFDLDTIYVIYNGVDTTRFRPGLKERFRKGIPQFLFVGNLYKHKKVQELILALKKILKSYPEAHLQIVGGGCAFSKLEHLLTSLNLQDHVTLVGRVSDSDLPYYYASCDVYVTSSRYEVCPIPLLEAMACGKPITASSIPSHSELLSRSKSGVLYTLADVEELCAKIIRTYRNRDHYKDNAIRFAQKNNWSTVTNKVLRVYNSILSGT